MSDLDEVLKPEISERMRSPTPAMLNFSTYLPSPSGTHLSSVQNIDPVIATPFQPNVDSVEGWSATLNLNHIFTSKNPEARRNVSVDNTGVDTHVKDKAKKVSSSFSSTIHTLYNDTSVFMYRTNDRIHRKLPQIVREKVSTSRTHD
ncbi:hypothetical protein K7432_004417 [Basidiobolus ranarum]|uniref:Uncharacterized protein n=1 Tax=Basidiobolus ranarum TaxID=34480 RepID=A0ABR2WY58_9FUNG